MGLLMIGWRLWTNVLNTSFCCCFVFFTVSELRFVLINARSVRVHPTAMMEQFVGAEFCQGFERTSDCHSFAVCQESGFSVVFKSEHTVTSLSEL